MKTTKLLFTLLLLSIFYLKGQDYVYCPFVEEDTRWSYAFIRHPVFAPPSYSIYRIKGDTTINGLNYKKLLYGCTEVYSAAFREENKRVYMIREKEEEKLLFDFNLKEGDWMKSGITGNEYLVAKIDTILLGETKRKRFVFDLYETWIEGIGALEDFYPLQGRLLSFDAQGINFQKKGTEIVYKTDEWYLNENDCNFNNIKTIFSSDPFTLIQRKGEIELQRNSDGFESGQVFVYSVFGNIVFTKPVERNANILISTSTFPNGVYIVRFINTINNSGNSYVGKFIVKKY